MPTIEEFVFRAVDEVGATLNTALVVMGDRLGLYRALTDGALTPGELAERTGTTERYVREWLNAQAAGGYVTHEDGRYRLEPEQAVALTDEDSPYFLPGFFELALGSVLDSPRITEVVRDGGGVGWHEHDAPRPRRLRALLPARLQREPDRVVVAGARRRRRAAGTRGARGRRRLRAWRLDDPDGQGVPGLELRRLRLPRGLDRDGAGARTRGGVERARALRRRARGRVRRRGLRPGDDVRLPARHGRPGRRGAARAEHAERRRARG